MTNNLAICFGEMETQEPVTICMVFSSHKGVIDRLTKAKDTGDLSIYDILKESPYTDISEQFRKDVTHHLIVVSDKAKEELCKRLKRKVVSDGAA